MWNEKLEVHASKMRDGAGRLKELLRLQEPERRRGYRAARISDESQRVGLERAWAIRRRKGDLHRNRKIEIESCEPKPCFRGTQRPEAATFPLCPDCDGATSVNTIRAGFARNIQRFRCRLCRRTFSGPTVLIKLEPYDYEMVCYHCGNNDVNRIGKGYSKSRTGRMGFCNKCKRRFVQGGLKDLQKYHLLLEKRIIDVGLPTDVEAEVLQLAAEDVLIGKGYCWSVKLRLKEAWYNTRGEYGQRGSDHPVFRLEQGQKYAY